MSVNIQVNGEFRGFGSTEFTDRQTNQKVSYPYIRLEVEEETQKISIKPEAVKELETKLKKGQLVSLVARAYAKESNLKLSYVRLA